MKIQKILTIFLVISLTLGLCGCDENHEEKNNAAEIVIACKNTEEQVVLANLASILITEKTNHKVIIEDVDNITSKSLFEDLKDKKVDIYFDYAGSIYENALELPMADMPYATIMVQLQKTLIEQGIFVSESLGYDGGNILFIIPEKREELGDIATISELKKKAKHLRVGMEQGFYSRDDCYKKLCKTYDLTFKEAEVYTEKEGFFALRRGEIDIMVGSRTSVYNNMYNLYLLRDDKRFFPPETLCYLGRDQFLLDYPEVKESLTILEDLMTSGTMSIMKRRVYVDHLDMDTYLHDFLRARNLL